MRSNSLEAAIAESVTLVEKALDRLLPEPDDLEARLLEAMRYAVFAGGKRLRPFLVLASARIFNVSEGAAARAAAAIECVHTYSMVHDDLPAMDDDDLRRGRPTVHRQFDEATAILAGTGLFALAFEILAHPDTHGDAGVRNELIVSLARASGAHGMMGGQMIDLQAIEWSEAGSPLDIGGVTRLQQLKTGALIAFSCEAGAILGRSAPELRHALHAYAHDLGLAYQIRDDLLDIEGDEEAMGKAVGKDAELGKATFVSLLGHEKARRQAELLSEQAVEHLAAFDREADLLRDLAHFVISRKS